MFSDRDQLYLAVEELKRAIEVRKGRIETEFPSFNPYEVVDTAGRSILLDALTALVNAQAVLVASGAGDS